MASATIDPAAELFPTQVCFMVDDVQRAAEECVARFGWGPFRHFTADVPDSHYRGWCGRRHNDVALGMAGRVQVELLHVHEGRAAISDYQAEYGRGFQHLGIACGSREAALERLEALGASLDESNEFGGTRFAFVDVPTGPAMFELLDHEGEEPGRLREATAEETESGVRVLGLDRATIVTADIDSSLRFYAQAFGWEDARAEPQTLRHAAGTSCMRRFVGHAGWLDLELVEPAGTAEDPYSRHRARGPHGLVHAGGPSPEGFAASSSVEYEWLETGERFALYDWAGGPGSLQLRGA
ncbi:MAG: VOC family protein [Deltaproteobacteria bacterium]|jgi:catechol 2,3-dioxygenase-like lactoylglutathione lyase family enzyme|nr:VOC family protein [Deltaproteobacteria bacterium]